MDPRGTKRAGHSISTDLSKRRGPYALRACIACRRRKGKCDGQQPCDYCDNREQPCIYDGEGMAVRCPGSQPTLQNREPGQASRSQPQPEPQPHLQPQTQDTDNGAAISKEPSAPSDDPVVTRSSLAGMVASLRAQLNNVESMVEAHDREIGNPETVVSKGLASTEPLRPHDQSADVPNRQRHAVQEGDDLSVTSPCFYGPTSPNYSMNLVQITLRERGYIKPSPYRPMLASFDGDNAVPSSTSHWQPTRQCDWHQLLQFRSWLTLQEAKDAVSTYHEVVGELHPFVDSERIKSQLEWWYSYDSSQSSSGNSQQPGDDDLVILVLMLATAAQAQGDTIHAKMAPVMHSSFQHAVNAAATSSITSIKQVTIVLLLGYYYFSHDLPRLALRMCGTAGRMLMELGFHYGDMLNNVLKSDAQRKQISTMMCSVMIFDRQWSAMTGLPANFPNATFSPMSAYLGDAPYTKAMYKLILISDRFNEPVSLAAKGSSYADDDIIELLVFQIQQWQKKSVGDKDLSDIKAWLTEPSTVPPSWLLLLIFRAASIQSLLLRSYFFPTSDPEKSKLHLLPAMELASNVTEALSGLDSATTIYRNQRPYYQHILASICALMFLVASYVDQHRSAFSPHLPAGYDDQIRHCFQLASKLAQKYANVSKAADILWTRIRELCYAMETYGSQHGDVLQEPPSSAAPKAGSAVANFSSTEAGEEPWAVGDSYCETEPSSFGATLDLEFSIDGDSSLLQDVQAWGLTGWPSNSYGYLFQ